ncbi:GAF domain-containing sensor histidine kinase [Aggregatilinea lenta]|uniref:GAF domain-containing sensor histidine kinase n=1 Tax=Aggregatilinea lenta TaxID=913108 RepID=UPI0013C2F08A|nr:GAF domain-containing sensor histidine kinase [Aggregatilinea lenta]
MMASGIKPNRLFTEPLIKRLSIQFLILGILPTVLLTILPTLYLLTHGIEPLSETLLVMGLAQGLVFLMVVFTGAMITFQRLAIPVQELIKGAEAIAGGNLTYRVPVRRTDREMMRLMERFNSMAASVESMRNNIEEQRQTLQYALAEREQEFEVILNVARQINRQSNVTQSTQRALAIAQANLGSDFISLLLLDDNKQISSIVSTCLDCGSPTVCQDQCTSRKLLNRALHRMQPTLLLQATETRNCVRVWDTHTREPEMDEALIEALDDLNVHKMHIRPLITQDRVIGHLVMMRHRVQHIPARNSTLMEMLAELITIILENRQLQNKARKLTIMEERHRLASELHDSVTQSLFTLSLTARGLKSSLGSVGAMSDANQQALDVLVGQTKIVQKEMRTLINELRPIDLEANSLEDALRQHIQSLRCSTNTEVQFTIDGSLEALPKPVQRNLNRIVQEALSNIARHASAQHTTIDLAIRDDLATLNIRDDGQGFDLRAVALQQSASLGLISMRERTEMLGGTLLVRSQPGTETVITARIPICQQVEQDDGS